MEGKENQNLEEKEIVVILDSFEREFNERFQSEDRELQKVKFYENFEIRGIRDAEISGVFVTEELDSNGNTIYHLYYGEPSNEILSVDADGKVQVSENWQETLKGIDLEKTLDINDREEGRLKGISEKAKPEEMKKALKGSKEPEQDEEKENAKQIEQDLQEQGEDLQISEYKKIKDSHISERMPEVFKDGEENGIAFSNKLNRFVIISKVNEQYKVNKNVEPARMTWKTIISIDPEGNRVERKVPHALMQLPNNSEKEIAVTLDDYGDADIETVDVLPCQERIAREVRSEGEGIEKEESLEMRRAFQQEGKEYKHDIAHQVKEIEQAQREENKTVDYDITPNDYIPNTEMTWGELMDETGESLPKLIERYDNEMKGQGMTSEEAVETIEEDYGRLPGQR